MLFPQQLDEVGDGLEEPEGAGSIGAVARLHASEKLALHPGQVCEGAENEVDDEERLDQIDPPRLIEVVRHA